MPGHVPPTAIPTAPLCPGPAPRLGLCPAGGAVPAPAGAGPGRPGGGQVPLGPDPARHRPERPLRHGGGRRRQNLHRRFRQCPGSDRNARARRNLHPVGGDRHAGHLAQGGWRSTLRGTSTSPTATAPCRRRPGTRSSEASTPPRPCSTDWARSGAWRSTPRAVSTIRGMDGVGAMFVKKATLDPPEWLGHGRRHRLQARRRWIPPAWRSTAATTFTLLT